MDQEVSIQGIVVEVRFANPHSLLFIDVANEADEVDRWTIETGPPLALRAAGWSSRTVPVGSKITVYGRPARSGAPTLALLRIVLQDGSELSSSSAP